MNDEFIRHIEDLQQITSGQNFCDCQEVATLLNEIEAIEEAAGDVPEPVAMVFAIIKDYLSILILKDIEPIEDEELTCQNLQISLKQIHDYFINQEIPTPVRQIQLSAVAPITELLESDIEEETPADMVDSDIEDDIFADFLTEAGEYIEQLESDIILLEENPTDSEIINQVFRPFHTLKGVSGFMGLKKMNKIAHETENLLDMARNGRMAVSHQFIEAVLTSIDVLKLIIKNLSVDDRTEVVEDDKVKQYTAFLQSLQAQAQEAIAVVPAMQASDLVSSGEQAERPEKGETDASIRIRTSKLDYLIDMVGELVISSNLIKGDSNVLAINEQHFLGKLSQLSRVVTELQMAAMSLRMVPIASTFQKMKRVVRDLSVKSGKQIELELNGQETEVDRHLVDSLYDPLVHMIRNSADHGLEATEERTKLGKPETGLIRLNALHRGNDIVVQVIDDGRGLNGPKISEKALEKGIATQVQLDEMTDEQIWKLIFAPGFSTADKVTSISGRGVGMDVVMSAIKALGGNIAINSDPGKGCTFEMSIPLTLSIVEGLLVNICQELFVIPVTHVKRFIQPDMRQINMIVGKGRTVKLEDHLLPIVYFEDHYKLNKPGKSLDSSVLVIVDVSGKQFALKVDEIVSIQDIVVKNVGKKFSKLKVISGATILGNGSVGLIVDVSQIIPE